METKTRVSDIIPASDIEKWKPNDVITISAGTGRGKSFFIKNVLYEYAKAEHKKILMLIHRSNCVNQFRKEIERDNKRDTIDIQTYQKLESDIINERQYSLEQYKYIVCDEFHYFISDAAFNNRTDISFNAILSVPNAIKLFMSATGENMKKYINHNRNIETIDYNIPLDFSFIKQLSFFHRDSTLDEYINEAIQRGDKGIFFIQNASKAYDLYKKHKKYCLFNCSSSNKNYGRYVDTDQIEKMLVNEKFEQQFLITTSCFDAGINIRDSEVRNIVIDITDINSLIQCIGRKRIDYNDPADKVNLYIKVINNQRLGGFETQTKKQLEMADFLNSHSTAELIKEYPRMIDHAGIIYDAPTPNGDKDNYVKQVNFLMYIKKKLDIVEFQQMKGYGNFGYCIKLAKLFGFDGENGRPHYKLPNEDYSLIRFMQNNLNTIMLQPKDRKALINKINVRSDGKQLKSLDTLNSALEERQIDYHIEEFSTTKVINGKMKRFRNAWKIVKNQVVKNSIAIA